jgi:glycosyltransferase involved in cell wall biosynthesis
VVVVAAHNEADRIAATLGALALAFPGAPRWVADDGSSDHTGEIARAAGARVVRSERVIGKGAAMTATVGEALLEARELGEQRRVFVLCDGDLAESARALGPLAQPVASGDCELAVAVFAKRLGGGFGLAVGFARWAIHARCGLSSRAPISGQRALSERALRETLPFAAGYGMEMAMTIDAVRAGRQVKEIELELSHRASTRTPAGFAHRARQLLDFLRVYISRR